MRNLFKSAKTLAAVCVIPLMLSACAADSTRYRADVYGAEQVNRMQRVYAVEILSVGPAQIAVPNDGILARAQGIGAVIGAVTGVILGGHNSRGRNRTERQVAGGRMGGAAGGLAGTAAGGFSSTAYADGVQLVFRAPSGRVLQSTQVGSLCEFRTGSATLVATFGGETRIQPNNPNGCRR